MRCRLVQQRKVRRCAKMLTREVDASDTRIRQQGSDVIHAPSRKVLAAHLHRTIAFRSDSRLKESVATGI